MKALTAVGAFALVVGCGPLAHAKGTDSAFVIESISNGAITLEGGGRVFTDSATKVVKKGYEFTIKDLRPGWAITTSPTPGGEAARYGPVRKIEVVGIPVVRSYPPYTARPTTVAVGRAELGLMPAVQALAGVDVQQAIESITASVLGATGRFSVIDLGSRDEVQNEQDFAHSGYADAASAPKAGRLKTARYLVKVCVTDFDYATRSGNGVGAFGFEVGKNKARSRLAMELRLVDTNTGITKKIVRTVRMFGADTLQFQANLSATAAALVPNAGSARLKDLDRLAAARISVAHNGYVQSPIGELISLAINDLAEKLLADLG